MSALGRSDVGYARALWSRLKTQHVWLLPFYVRRADPFTRFRRDAQGVVSRVGLLLLDEIHLLNDPGRGPTLEAVVARMRTLSQSADVRGTPIAALRTVSLSATIRSNAHSAGPSLAHRPSPPLHRAPGVS